MASKQTTNYGLNQWAAEDRVMRTEFNADNAKLDGALTGLGERTQALEAAAAALDTKLEAKASQTALEAVRAAYPRVTVGSYVGTGEVVGRTLDFTDTLGRPPLLVIVRPKQLDEARGAVLIRGMSHSMPELSGDYNSAAILPLTWSGNALTWGAAKYDTYCLNEEDVTYFYFAIG